MSSLPKRVQINEEGPREGFQIEPGPIPTERKAALVNALAATGLSTDAALADALIAGNTAAAAAFAAAKADRDVVRTYDANKAVDLEYRDSVLRLDLNLRKAVAGDYDIAFDLKDLPNDINRGSRTRLAEIFEGAPLSPDW